MRVTIILVCPGEKEKEKGEKITRNAAFTLAV
jgi:hypothetical protein